MIILVNVFMHQTIYVVFARTSPEQKLTIVQEFTKAGNVTAMTGEFISRQ